MILADLDSPLDKLCKACMTPILRAQITLQIATRCQLQNEARQREVVSENSKQLNDGIVVA